MSAFVALTDTCALFPQSLRDVLLRAAEAELYRVRWSEDILEELRRNLQKQRGLTEEQAQHLLSEMRAAFPEATVTGYGGLVASMTNHPEDRHVLAAAVCAGAQVIVTDNLRDFPEAALAPYNIEAWPPDEFLGYLCDRYSGAMARIVLDSNAARRRPPEPLAQTLDRLAKSAPKFVQQIRAHRSVFRALERERL